MKDKKFFEEPVLEVIKFEPNYILTKSNQEKYDYEGGNGGSDLPYMKT